ncbi:MAG: PH1570 family protein [Lachnospiraceae bacterium]|nr:PH1570 family protein [Lachnospiraceae bacterium]MDD3615246.1 PH1570 family protein [Lachnospiraceae bacterium]
MNKRVKKKKTQYWEKLLKTFTNPETEINDKIFNYLLRAKILLIELGHMEFDDTKMQLLAPYVDEARETLLERAFFSDDYSAEVLESYLYKYELKREDEGTLIYLMECNTNNLEKKKCLINFCKRSNSMKISKIARNVEFGMELVKCIDVDFIKNTYQKNLQNPYILMAIAKNPITPQEIKKELKNVKGIKYAAQIRNIV